MRKCSAVGSSPLESITLNAIPCTGGPDVIQKEAWSFHRTGSSVRLCWELEEPKRT